jgi:uncharacterized protein YdeI (BOF family)
MGEIRGELKGLDSGVARLTDGQDRQASDLGAIRQQCAAHAARDEGLRSLLGGLTERIERHSDALRILRDSSGQISAIVKEVDGHGVRLDEHDKILSGGRAERVKGRYSIWVAVIAASGGLGAAIAALVGRLAVGG